MNEQLQPKPFFSPGNPFWQPAFFRTSQRDFLNASHWEMRRPSPLWLKSDRGWKTPLHIAFLRGGVWKTVRTMQLRNWLKWNWRKLLKESRGEAKLSQAATQRSELQTPVEVA